MNQANWPLYGHELHIFINFVSVYLAYLRNHLIFSSKVSHWTSFFAAPQFSLIFILFNIPGNHQVCFISGIRCSV
jgi:hypothetical protein